MDERFARQQKSQQLPVRELLALGGGEVPGLIARQAGRPRLPMPGGVLLDRQAFQVVDLFAAIGGVELEAKPVP
ncbi:hypothetical protein [Comamonas sp. JUb58]|uniref:hypothetical protein n=1 Tax=Comamonas sp. JUb58 TaxID=2485114 RepID=UPI001060F996|nr:hypothetical protein [Comamonas sp. JUb58]